MSKPDKKKPTRPEPQKKQPDPEIDPEIDVDDAQIEPPRDDAFKKKEPHEDLTAKHLKERENHRG